jgi:hypothetical protein
LAFFGTPHSGVAEGREGNKKMFASIVNTMIGRNPSTDEVEALEKSSTLTETLKELFRNRLDDFQIRSFFESNESCVSFF